MNRAHAEPWNRPLRCVACGLPNDPDRAFALRQQAEAEEQAAGGETWSWCKTCGNATCSILQRLCAVDAEREAER